MIAQVEVLSPLNMNNKWIASAPLGAAGAITTQARCLVLDGFRNIL